LPISHLEKGKSLSITSCLPILGKHSQGMVGCTVNVLAVICSVIGIAISLGLGAIQMSKGIEYSFSMAATFLMQVTIMLLITLLSTISVVSGVTKGVKYLSILNMALSFFLLCFIFFSSGAIVAIKHIVVDLSTYIQDLAHHSLWSALHDYRKDGNIINWTTFHWSAWIAWSPFVGMFIARISKGRTIREYLLGAILVPTLLSTVWFSVLGHSAIQSLQGGIIDLGNVLKTDHATIFFVFLSQYSGGILLYGLAILCLKLFFITSADSAAFVIATMANEKGKPSTKGKTYWSIAVCLVAITLLASGGLDVMQVVSIVSSIPFAFISLLMLGCLFKELRAEVKSNTEH
jgi:choline-glycine betaine transporter